jgi:hypothetical protein
MVGMVAHAGNAHPQEVEAGRSQVPVSKNNPLQKREVTVNSENCIWNLKKTEVHLHPILLMGITQMERIRLVIVMKHITVHRTS